jgi:hypothetical protein
LRGAKSVARAGESVNVPANAPHSFVNAAAARFLCLCLPAGLEEFFLEIGVRVAARTTTTPKLDAGRQAASWPRPKRSLRNIAPNFRSFDAFDPLFRSTGSNNDWQSPSHWHAQRRAQAAHRAV